LVATKILTVFQATNGLLLHLIGVTWLFMMIYCYYHAEDDDMSCDFDVHAKRMAPSFLHEKYFDASGSKMGLAWLQACLLQLAW
jgi:hypothetical protein